MFETIIGSTSPINRSHQLLNSENQRKKKLHLISLISSWSYPSLQVPEAKKSPKDAKIKDVSVSSQVMLLKTDAQTTGHQMSVGGRQFCLAPNVE